VDKIFISVIEEEQYVANAISMLLSDFIPLMKYAVFHAARIEAGENWLDRIRRELKDAALVLSVLSPASVHNPWIHFEGGAAWLAGKRLIPLCHGLAKGDLPYPWSTLQAIQIPDQASDMVSAIARILNVDQPVSSDLSVSKSVSEHFSYEHFKKNLELGPKMRNLQDRLK